MSSRFIIRFDDVCPTMNWAVWDEIEQVLIASGIRPIVAIVPDNRDPKLNFGPPLKEFWRRVREWQERGWTIGWHGFRHVYETNDSGLIGLNSRSEFAGLEPQVQAQKLRDAYAIFAANRVLPDIWVAPAHSFDQYTVELLQGFGVRVISDGYYFKPLMRSGSLWIPQQLWRFRRLPIGLWTVCYHINRWSGADIVGLRDDLMAFASKVTSVPDVVAKSYSGMRMRDAAFAAAYRRVLLMKRLLKK